MTSHIFNDNPSTPAELIDRLGARTKQLAALTCTMYGDDPFSNHSEHIKDAVAWLAHDLAEEIDHLAVKLGTTSAGMAA